MALATEPLAKAAAASYDDRAVMISLRTRKLGNRRMVDEDEIAEVDDAGKADRGERKRPVKVQADKAAVCFTKRILDCEEYRAIKNLDSRVERYLKDKCLPSPLRRGKGIFLLPFSLVEEVDAKLLAFLDERSVLVDKLIAVYPERCKEESARLRKLHVPGEYEDVRFVRAAYELSWEYIGFSVPTALKAISSEIWKREQAKSAKAWADARAEISRVLRASMAKLIDHLVEKLADDPETGKAQVIQAFVALEAPGLPGRLSGPQPGRRHRAGRAGREGAAARDRRTGRRPEDRRRGPRQGAGRLCDNRQTARRDDRRQTDPEIPIRGGRLTMPVLRHLPGTSGDRECVSFRTVTRCMKIIKSGLAATAAADNGAINVWRDDDGRYRCHRMRFLAVKDSHEFEYLEQVRAWLPGALAKIKGECV